MITPYLLMYRKVMRCRINHFSEKKPNYYLKASLVICNNDANPHHKL